MDIDSNNDADMVACRRRFVYAVRMTTLLAISWTFAASTSAFLFAVRRDIKRRRTMLEELGIPSCVHGNPLIDEPGRRCRA